MDEIGDWAFPESVQPQPEDVRFDLEAALDAVVQVRAEVPEDAFTASILGTERTGNGVVIRDDGLVLTIGYLITEAESIWLTTNRGTVVAGHTLAYDQATGFGLVQPLGRLDVAALPRGSASNCMFGDDVIVIGHGGREHALKAKVIAVREFAGYWEYVLDEAVFTAPAHPQWGGAALVGEEGRLLGIGSLLVEETVAGQSIQGNMIVPIDLLGPILDDMLAGPRRAAGTPVARHVHDGGARSALRRRTRRGRACTQRRRENERHGARGRGRARHRPGGPLPPRVATRRRRRRGPAHACARRRSRARSSALGRPERFPEEAPAALTRAVLSGA